MMAFFAPASDSTVRSIKSSRACTSTWSHTSSGARFSSMSRRLNANSVFEADGKPISISLNPIFTSVWKSSSFWLTFMGTASAWLPSRKSTLHQRGARVRTRLGHCRSGKATGGNGRYFFDAGLCMFFFSCGGSASVWQNKNPTAGWAVGFDKTGERIRTRPPRGTAAARLAADSDSNCDSRSQDNHLASAGQTDFHACFWSAVAGKLAFHGLETQNLRRRSGNDWLRALAIIMVERRVREHPAGTALRLAREFLLPTGVHGQPDCRLLVDKCDRPCAPAQGRAENAFGEISAGLATRIVERRNRLAGLYRGHHRPDQAGPAQAVGRLSHKRLKLANDPIRSGCLMPQTSLARTVKFVCVKIRFTIRTAAGGQAPNQPNTRENQTKPDSNLAGGYGAVTGDDQRSANRNPPCRRILPQPVAQK